MLRPAPVTMATLPVSSLVVMPVPQLVIVRESGRPVNTGVHVFIR
jgi:hypothetical protein